MPRYHLFGKTVTIAEEIEQNGTAGRVEISAATQQVVRDSFDWLPLEPIRSTAAPDDIHRFAVRDYIGPPEPYACDDDDDELERHDEVDNGGLVRSGSDRAMSIDAVSNLLQRIKEHRAISHVPNATPALVMLKSRQRAIRTLFHHPRTRTCHLMLLW